MEAKQPQKHSQKFWIAVISVGLVLFLASKMCSSPETKKDSATEIKKGIDSTSLWYYSKSFAKDYVKQQLKSPSTAEFPDKDFKVWFEPDSTVTIKCAVDAQNSYGAMIRGNYYLKMKWKKDFKDSDNWTLITIQNED